MIFFEYKIDIKESIFQKKILFFTLAPWIFLKIWTLKGVAFDGFWTKIIKIG